MPATTAYTDLTVNPGHGSISRRSGRIAAWAALLGCSALIAPAHAQDTAPPGSATTTSPAGDAPSPVTPPPSPTAPGTAETPSGEIIVTGSLNALPLKGQGTVFGFDKTLVETPRSASSISSQQLERFGIKDIYDLVSQVPGTFSSSFFGTGGALDIRGTPGEVYFRGVLRLENPGNYPTPIGAADRIDIVRGPASPIYGPSKTGGYINFVPKTARAENGTYASEPTGFLSYTRSSYDGNDLKASITGPFSIGEHKFGYSLFGEFEDDGSYYRNVHEREVLLSGSIDTDITSNLRTEFGGVYQKNDGQQNSGWNRITQDLIDHGTYIAGNASATNAQTGKPIDTNGDGYLSREEVRALNGGNGLTTFGSSACGVSNFPASLGPTGYTNACFNNILPNDALVNPHTVHLSRRDTLTGPDDKLNNQQLTGYFDLIFTGKGNLEIKNQLFYDGTHNLNENFYGFSQIIRSYALEDKIVLSDKFTPTGATISVQASPSLRLTHFKFGDDFGAEYWNRPDLTTGYVPASTRLLSTECNCDYSDFVNGHYLDFGIAALVDVDFDFGLDIIAGGRWDHVHARAASDLSKIDPTERPDVLSASNNDSGFSWNGSVSYKTPFGLIPYFTASHQTTITAGEGAELEPDSISPLPTASNPNPRPAFLSASKLYEAGIKGEFLDKRLYAAVAVYKQERTEAATEQELTNQRIRTKGIEGEVRWSVDRHLLVTGNYTYINLVNLSALNGFFFNYFGVGDLINTTDPSLEFGGSQIGLLFPSSKKFAERPGIPHYVASGTATYAFDNGIAINGDLSHVSHTFAGYTQHVQLPSYWLLNLGASYTTGPFLFRIVVKNVNNARYFRAGGQDLFGADIVLPQIPRNFQATVQYKF